MQNQPKGPGDQLTTQVCAGLMSHALSALATTVSVFIRTDFGEEAFGGFTGLGAFIILVLAAAGDRAMFWYFWCWLIALLLARSKTAANKRAGRLGHSRYNGFPAVAMKLFRSKTETRARNVEPFLSFFAGFLMYQVSESVGQMVMLGAVGMGCVETSLRWVDHRKLQAMRDAQVEAQRMAAMYRGHEF